MLFRSVKKLPAMRETGFDPWVRKNPWRREWLPTPVFLPGEFHGQRSQSPALAGRFCTTPPETSWGIGNKDSRGKTQRRLRRKPRCAGGRMGSLRLRKVK